MYQSWKTLLVVVKLPLSLWLGSSQVTRDVDLLDHWELLQSGDWIQNAFYFCHYSQQRLIIQAFPMCFQKWSQNGSCWPNLSFPNSTHMTCQRRVLVPFNLVTTLFLQERLIFPVIHLRICFPQFSFSTNEITSNIWEDWSDISSPCNQSLKS